MHILWEANPSNKTTYKELAYLPNVKEINMEYKERFLAVKEKLGRTPTTADKEFWEVSEWYRSEFDVDRIKRVAAENAERAAERKLAEQPIKVVEKICRTEKCSNIIPPKTGRGRPPVYCVDCRNKKKEKKGGAKSS